MEYEGIWVTAEDCELIDDDSHNFFTTLLRGPEELINAYVKTFIIVTHLETRKHYRLDVERHYANEDEIVFKNPQQDGLYYLYEVQPMAVVVTEWRYMKVKK